MRKNNGFSIVELLVAMVVSFIVISGLYSLLTSSVVNFGFSKASNNASDTNMRMSKFLDGMIFQAGFINYTRELGNQKFSATSSHLDNTVNWRANQIVFVDGNNDLYIRYYGSSLGDDVDKSHSGVAAGLDVVTANGFIYDCGGQAVPNNRMVEARLSVTAQGLVCDYVIINTNTGAEAQGEQQVVLDPSIVAARFLVGNSTANVADMAFSANPDDWSKVDVLVYSFISSQSSSQRAVRTRTLTLDFFNFVHNDARYQYQIPQNQSSNVHRIYSNTVSLVNARLL